MRIVFYAAGVTRRRCIREECRLYADRIAAFFPFSMEEIPARSSGMNEDRRRKNETAEVLRRMRPDDFVVLLDERGREMTSPDFASFLNRCMHSPGKNRLVFVAGGPWGVDTALRERADFLLALSRMTFPHELVRVIFLEQLYRASDILRGGSYHH